MHNNVGNTYRKAGKLNEARAHLEKAKEMMMLMHQEEPVEEMAKVKTLLLSPSFTFFHCSGINCSNYAVQCLELTAAIFKKN